MNGNGTNALIVGCLLDPVVVKLEHGYFIFLLSI